ncbi:pseudoazurin [Puniceibacterium confluentis]|uniref:pseudoazurin n=1 Tax=Puniceibacterium confluentis TaxID=1958944 RepID=UPI0011B5D1F6|nr:pseudoazurin [Puniceibacterium confluentis]
MIRNSAIGVVVTTLLSTAAVAETIEIKMLNKTADGERMAFEPAFVQIQPGDVVKFIATDKGHNAETVKGMIPEGSEGFNGKINEEIEIPFEIEGLYGVMCKPHYAMGMVMTVAVGVSEAPDGFLNGRVPKKAKARFEDQLGNL